MIVLVEKFMGEVQVIYGPFETADEAWDRADKRKASILGTGLGIDKHRLNETFFYLSQLQG